MKDSYKSALYVMDGVKQPGQINPELAKKLLSRRTKSLTVAEYVEGIRAGNRTVLSQAITLVESSLHKDQEKAQTILTTCLKDTSLSNDSLHSASSIRIGITGVPGVGKSTFIEALGTYLTGKGHKLAVLAIDPSSSRSKGSILGDKTRMEALSVDPNAFIRPSPSAGSLGGVARKTRETILLCEAAGFNIIFIETVGVGQSETTVHGMVDFFLLLMLAGAGDELQGIKRGIIEMADAIVINKADGDNLIKAQAAQTEYLNALHLFPPPESGWIPVVDICSSRTNLGIENVWKIILDHQETTSKSGYFQQHRKEQNLQVFIATIEEELKHHFFSQKDIAQAIVAIEQELIQGQLNPYLAAQQLLKQYFQKR
ncbi:MAG: methylmalonyl Co-A mutase-associated GTPase MeaB [Bacteroidales bacterium]|nr:methylmalonyl Co-A mutase-associated GTPase MeaB [Bacteroidales bacterium]MDD4603479.1 methylmalonyl Co-A mutase-associated GTPase MeaB [Bacteroidales bacterium]